MSGSEPIDRPHDAADGRAPAIGDLPRIVESLAPTDQIIFRRIFQVSATEGQLVPPAEMLDWIVKQFGSVEAVRRQRIVKTTNVVTFEGSLFNELRAHRPIERLPVADLDEAIEEGVGDPFCHPEQQTPADVFGRIYGRWSITASNVAKYDGFHGVVIFADHNPYHFTRASVADAIETGLAWARRAHAVDPQAKYPFFMWNCLWKSGASIVHGHAQVSLGREMHYAKIEHLRRAALTYRARHNADYFDDLYRAHAAVGAGFMIGPVRAMAYLTPVKEKEIFLIGDQIDDDLKTAIAVALACYRRLGVTAFNLAILMPPIGPTPEDWSHFPVIVRLIDRGDPLSRTSDFGAMEIYASSVIAADPFLVARALKTCAAGIADR